MSAPYNPSPPPKTTIQILPNTAFKMQGDAVSTIQPSPMISPKTSTAAPGFFYEVKMSGQVISRTADLSTAI